MKKKRLTELKLIEKLPVSVLSTFGHNGVDWTHSLLDSHPNILIMPAFSFFRSLKRFEGFHKSFEINKNKKFDLAKMHIFARLFAIYLSTDKSFKTKRRNFFFKKSDVSLFETNLLFALNNYRLKNFSKKLFFSIHYAFSKTHKIKIKDKMIIVAQEHLPWLSPKYEELFNSKYIFMMRDPRASFGGGILQMINSNSDRKINAYQFDMMLLCWISAYNFCKKIQKKSNIIILKNEEMHKNLKKEMKKLCKWLNIKFSTSCLTQTFMKKRWLGDSAYLAKDEISKKYPLNYYKPKKVYKRWNKILDKKDIFILELIFFKIFKKFKYKTNNKFSLLKYFLAVFLVFKNYQHQQKYAYFKIIILIRNIIRRFLILFYPIISFKLFKIF